MDLIIRQAQPDDAPQFLAHIQAIASEPEVQILLDPEEVQLTLEEERQWLTSHLASRNSTLLVAQIDGKIVGVLDCEGGQRNAVRHVAKLGVSVRSEWREPRDWSGPHGAGHRLGQRNRNHQTD